jgi:hypothetical protein
MSGRVCRNGHLDGGVLSLGALRRLMPSQVKHLCRLEEENARLCKVVADLMLGRRCFRSKFARNYDASYVLGTQDDRIYAWRFSCANRGSADEPVRGVSTE